MRTARTVAALLLAGTLAACGETSPPFRPSRTTPAASAVAFGTLSFPAPAATTATVADAFGRCLAGSSDATCFSASLLPSARAAFSGVPTLRVALEAAASDTAPEPPTSLASSVYGSSVYLYWRAPATGPAPTGYYIEAGSSAGVARGTYYVRVRARNTCGVSGASNEAIVRIQ